MPRKTKKEWTHPLYAYGYCYERYGRVYLRYKDKKKATHLNWLDANKEEAFDLLEDFIKSQVYEVKEEFTISYVRPKFLDHIKNKTSIRNYNAYIQQLPILIKKDFDLKDTIGIREHIQKNINSLSNLKQNTLANYLNKVKALFTYAIENEYMIKHPVSNAMNINKIKSEHYTPSINEFGLVLNEIKKNSKRTNLFYVCKFILLTGLRIAELTNLKWIDISETSIKIYGKKKDIKQNRIRYFPLTPFPELVILLSEIKKQSFTNEYVFGNFKGAYHTRSLNQYCENLGIQQFQYHAIRRLAIECWKLQSINRTDRAILAGHDEAVQKANYELEININELANRILKQKS